MNLLVDTHTHTVASGHAYSTLKENAQEAFAKGLEAFVCADHGPAVPGCAPGFTFSSVLSHVPEVIEGVRVFRGVELNILDFDGTVDVEPKYLTGIDFGIASLHGVTYKSGSIEQNTQAMLCALSLPYVDVIGHPGNPNYPIDKERFVKEVAKSNKLVEINSHSFLVREGSEPNCKEIANLCKKHDVRIVVSSDAHICYHMGEFSRAVALLEECNFPEELVVSANLERFLGYLKEKQG